MKLLAIINMLYIFFMLQACTKQQTKMDKDNFSYSVTFSAPGGEYPAEVHYGYLTDDKKELVAGVPKAGITNGKWQYDGSEAGQGGNVVPTHLNLIYVAYAEKKFYQVDADLPKNKMLELFREGFTIEGSPDSEGNYPWVPDTYKTLTIGVAPGGVVVVWLSGNHHRREVYRLQAKETFVDVNDFYQNADNENQEQFFDSWFKIAVPENVQSDIKQKGIPYGLWDKYREKYKYRFVLHPYDEKDYIKQAYRINYNGETEYLKSKEEVDKYKEDSVPYNVMFSFFQNNAEIIFDDNEILKVFEDFNKQNPNDPIDIIVRPKFRYKDFEVFVKCKDKEIKLGKINVKRAWGRG